MSVIVRNQYGAIAVNNGVIEKMIVEDLLEMSDRIILCNKKGKQIKDKPTPFIDPDYYDAVEYTDKKHETRVRVYIIANYGYKISEIAETIFDRIESEIRLLQLDLPGTITVNVKGIMAGQLVKRNIELVRSNS